MSVCLTAITNAKPPKIDTNVLDEIVLKLKSLKIPKDKFQVKQDKVNGRKVLGEVDKNDYVLIQGIEDWNYDIKYEEDGSLYMVHFTGDFMISPELLPNGISFYTSYRYWFIYENYSIDFFQEIRKELFEMLKIFGGSEIIYLADSGGDISLYYECEFLENKSYQEVKDKLISDGWEMITDFTKLNSKDYFSQDPKTNRPKEFFLDNFNDLK